jgi:hypothetical protein
MIFKQRNVNIPLHENQIIKYLFSLIVQLYFYYYYFYSLLNKNLAIH